jgi:hypothetical protein
MDSSTLEALIIVFDLQTQAMLDENHAAWEALDRIVTHLMERHD